MPAEAAAPYKSASQQARAVTESWGTSNFFCAACDSPRLRATPQGTAAIDYVCPVCDSPFQLKSQSKPLGPKILDAAYSEMRSAILEDRTPNLYLLHYDLAAWRVRTLLLIPQFAFALSAIERRKPLAPTARRAGWVGCNILLSRIPPEARIALVSEGRVVLPSLVRRRYSKLKSFAGVRPEARGWRLDVLNAIHTLGKREFTLEEAYSLAPALSALHPQNRNVCPKIRQQLQVLRDAGLLEFLGGGPGRRGGLYRLL